MVEILSSVKLCAFFEKTFDIDLGNYYKTVTEIKDRKNGRTKFLNMLSANLNQYFKNADEQF